ncbi:MAG TPA: IclR family transcriptional regulator C-terminal domain-containing protein, partial [Povalibacter sp.]
GFSVRVGFRRPLVAATSGLVLYAFQPEPTRAEWKARLSPAVSRVAWKDFEARAQAVRSRGFARVPSDVSKGVVDISAPVMHLGQVVAALTCPHLETREALTVDETAVALKLAARQLSDVLSGIYETSQR